MKEHKRSDPEHYVMGLCFNAEGTQVLLASKDKPAFWKDRLAGIGGRVKPHEMPMSAMNRVAFEHAHLRVDWRPHFPILVEHEGLSYKVDVFCAFGNLASHMYMGREAVAIYPIHLVPADRSINGLSTLLQILLRQFATLQKRELDRLEEIRTMRFDDEEEEDENTTDGGCAA